MYSELIIKRPNPADTKILKKEFLKFKANCPDYNDYTMNEFLQCRNSIYIIEGDIIPKYRYFMTYAIIGVKRVDLASTGVKDLKYYCNPYNRNDIDLVYQIDFMHINSSDDSNNSLIMSKLLEYALADKNDGFSVFKSKCSYMESWYTNALLNNAFEFDNRDKWDVDTYVRAPITDDTGDLKNDNKIIISF